MKEVTNITHANYSNRHLNKLALSGLLALTIGISSSLTGCGFKKDVGEEIANKLGINQQIEFENVTITIDGINLWLAAPLVEKTDKGTNFVAPAGYMKGPNNVYYKLSVDNCVVPAGYVMGVDGKSIYPVDDEIEYYVPNGYILVGDKIVRVVPSYVILGNNIFYNKIFIINKEKCQRYGDFVISIEDASLTKKYSL